MESYNMYVAMKAKALKWTTLNTIHYNRITALVVAGMECNWAKHYLRGRGCSDFAILAVVEWMKTSTGGRVSGNVKAIIQILNAV